MSDESSTSEKVNDFMNMKVADLREKCRSKGLSTAGTKAQLIARLASDGNESKEPGKVEKSIFAPRGIVLTAGPLFDFTSMGRNEEMNDVRQNVVNEVNDVRQNVVNEVNDVRQNVVNEVNDEHENMVNEVKDVQENVISEVKDERENVGNEVNDSPTISVDSPNSNPASIPFKKRAIAQAATESVGKVEKRIVLKRDHIPTPIIAPKSPVSVPPKTKNVIIATKSETTDLSEKIEDATKSETVKERKSVIRLAKEPVKSLSEGEKFTLRAERFKISSLKDNSETKSLFAAGHSSKLISSSELTSVETMKKRAERFGQNVSSVMRKFENEQKILKRKTKFGSISGNGNNGVSNTEETEKKKKRAERFGL